MQGRAKTKHAGLNSQTPHQHAEQKQCGRGRRPPWMAGALPARPARGVRLCPVSQLGLLSRLSFILGVECPTAGTAAPTQAFEDEVSVPTWAPATAARSVGPSGGLAEVCRSVSGEGCGLRFQEPVAAARGRCWKSKRGLERNECLGVVRPAPVRRRS